MRILENLFQLFAQLRQRLGRLLRLRFVGCKALWDEKREKNDRNKPFHGLILPPEGTGVGRSSSSISR